MQGRDGFGRRGTDGQRAGAFLRHRVVFLVVGVFLGIASSTVLHGNAGRAGRPADVVAAATTPVAPVDSAAHLTAGVPAGFARTEVGAVAAAASFVCTGHALLDMDPLAAEAAIRQMATTDTGDRQVSTTLDNLRALRGRLAPGTGPIAFRQAALASRVETFDQNRARIAVWNVGVLSRAGVASPQAGWAISTFDLVWERGDWHVASETVVPGPAPVLNDAAAPATTAQFFASLDGFVDFGSDR